MDDVEKRFEEFVELVKAMRRKQKDYFRVRSPQDLRESKDWERKVDQALAELQGVKTPTLFDGGDGAA